MENIRRPQALLELLQQKNHFLDKFFSMNTKGIEEFKLGNFDSLDQFYHNRESILNAIRVIDQRIADLKISVSEMTEDDKSDIRYELDIKNETVQLVIDQDLIILQYIETQKSRIIMDLKANVKTKSTIAKFKSPILPNYEIRSSLSSSQNIQEEEDTTQSSNSNTGRKLDEIA